MNLLFFQVGQGRFGMDVFNFFYDHFVLYGEKAAEFADSKVKKKFKSILERKFSFLSLGNIHGCIAARYHHFINHYLFIQFFSKQALKFNFARCIITQ
ncbi:MAG: hypothetical protein FD122_1470 [Stygiobacter sp.]|nr:MAG: hypothetical protein FD122_1470 [Stygiobacter sp.]KAF0217503.1 MAG: hypothetical protein FD178_547 [Ignavibacteria bacterium]